jgi:lysophosphatidylcholine acyltransferase/lyso-PAF acetyltransferase
LKRSKTERGQWHRQLLVFPEGTTTNGSAVISFKVGSFAGGVSVQPVAVSYPSNQTCDPSWVSGGPHPGEILFKLLCQPWNSMHVTFLPVYHPDAAEIADPVLFSTNVRRLIAAELGVPASDHTFDDVLLLMEAKKLGYQGGLRDCISELKNMRKILEIDLAKAKEYLHEFSVLDKSRKGLLSYPQFIQAFGSQDSDALRSLFCVLDVQDRGVINLVEYTTGLALVRRFLPLFLLPHSLNNFAPFSSQNVSPSLEVKTHFHRLFMLILCPSLPSLPPSLPYTVERARHGRL